MKKSDYIKERLHVIRTISTAISGILDRDIRLDNFGERHPNSYSIIIDDTNTDIVIGYEELIFIRTFDDIKELALHIQDRIEERPELSKKSEP